VVPLMKWYDSADRYMQNSDWKDFALLKFCLLALGVIAGLYVPEEKKRPVLIAAAALFFATYIPLMVKVFSVLLWPVFSGDDAGRRLSVDD
jgi:uncharacterized membrane protein